MKKKFIQRVFDKKYQCMWYVFNKSYQNINNGDNNTNNML